MKKKQVQLTQQARMMLRAKVRTDANPEGISRYQLSKETGVDQATLSRFLSGETGLSSESLDALAEYFGWKLSEPR